MKVVTELSELRAELAKVRAEGKTISFVPTMGNLHEGHLKLVKTALKHTDFVVSSIFVNPTQFGENEDMSAYPKTLEEDKKHLMADGCGLLYLPNRATMYPEPDLTRVSVEKITTLHCGSSRPGHFVGVATVVLKFFNQVQPDVAVFGLKDFQQFTVIKTMVENLFLPIKLIGVDTGRAEDGLAHSSRNNYLTFGEREIAPTLYKILQETAKEIQSGAQNYASLTRQAKESLNKAGLTPDYFNISRQNDLEPASESDTDIVILAAAYLGKARLIDNIAFEI
jgi:pantoate--beta-alanine ligase